MKWDAQNYQNTCGNVTRHGEGLVEVLKSKEAKKILDVGCGTGVLTDAISKFAQKVVGIDSSAAMVEKAKKDFPNLDFQVLDVCSMNWENEFDAVFSNAVFHFIKTQDVLLERINKALAAGGLLVCEFGAAGNIAALLDAVEAVCKQNGKAYSPRFFYPSQEEYQALLEKHGFCIESIVTYDLDTKLGDGEAGLRNWVNQVFHVEMERFSPSEKGIALSGIESALKPTQWDGTAWHLLNKRLRVVARKAPGNI